MEYGQNAYLTNIKNNTQEAISGLRDMIWIMDDKQSTVEHLVTRLGQFAMPYCEASEIVWLVQVTEGAFANNLRQEEKRNLYMILKEALNNSVKYAEASEIKLLISLLLGKLFIQFADNGKGYDPARVTEGNGLRNMRLRASQIRYRLHTESTSGTKIFLQQL
jgi:signal transduction histidine kinase